MRTVPVVNSKGEPDGMLAALNGSERVDIFPPGLDRELPMGYIEVGEHGMSPAAARRLARLLVYAAGRLEKLQRKAAAKHK